MGIGATEMVVILVVLILFIRPEDIPKTVRMLGKFYAQFMDMYRSFMREMNAIASIEEEMDLEAMAKPTPKETTPAPENTTPNTKA